MVNSLFPYFSNSLQRMEMPDRLVNILDAIFMEASSWKSNFAAYGMWIWEILVLFLQGRHSKELAAILLETG